MSKLPSFVKFPGAWIRNGGLLAFKWGEQGSDNLAALMSLVVLAHHMDRHDGSVRLTYEQLACKASLSRAKISAGLTILEQRRIIERQPNGRSTFQLTNYDPYAGWAALPAAGLYNEHGQVDAFTEFHLRRRAELDALKLYFLFAVQRNADLNMAQIGYEKIEAQSGVPRNQIRRALTILGANGLVHVERLPSDVSQFGVSNGYRLTYLKSRQHMGTTGRGLTRHDMF